MGVLGLEIEERRGEERRVTIEKTEIGWERKRKGSRREKTGKRTVFIQTVGMGDQVARDPELDRGSPADVGFGCLSAWVPYEVSICTSTTQRVIDVYTTSVGVVMMHSASNVKTFHSESSILFLLHLLLLHLHLHLHLHLLSTLS